MENSIKIEVANAIIESLWIKGLLSTEEQAKVKNEIAKTFSLKKSEQSTGRN